MNWKIKLPCSSYVLCQLTAHLHGSHSNDLAVDTNSRIRSNPRLKAIRLSQLLREFCVLRPRYLVDAWNFRHFILWSVDAKGLEGDPQVPPAQCEGKPTKIYPGPRGFS